MGLLKTILSFLGIDLDALAEQARTQDVKSSYSSRPVSGNFKAKEPVEIRYRNFKGEDRTFTAERYSIRPKGTFVTACVEPTGYRISLKKENIQNIEDISGVLEVFDLFPKGQDLKTLKYHMKRGTTSPRFEELKEQYSEWVAFETGN